MAQLVVDPVEERRIITQVLDDEGDPRLHEVVLRQVQGLRHPAGEVRGDSLAASASYHTGEVVVAHTEHTGERSQTERALPQ